MRRAIFMAMLALSLTLGSARMNAYPTSPIRTPVALAVSSSPETNLSGVQVFFLLLPIFVPSVG